MRYRQLPGGTERISVIGMGSSCIGEAPHEEIAATVRQALRQGINFFDMGAGHGAVFGAYGEALAGSRKEVFLQVHYGAVYDSGEYGWTTDLGAIKRSVEWQLKSLRTDYIDFAYISCIDEESDLAACERQGTIKHLLELKECGTIRKIGFSSHTPDVTNRALGMGIIDILMFSINPLFDYRQGEYANGSHEERTELYRRCEKEGVGIVVMKPFGGGALLDAAKSPFGKSLTPYQCLQYALDRPGVVSVVPGFANERELLETIGFLGASEDERDYSAISEFSPSDSEGRCVYCRHCHPCPEGLDIALINKYYDLAKMGDALAREHYLTLARTARDCAGCGHCDERCPFGVAQGERMKEIAAYFAGV